jgi:hypothetical protein
LHAAIFLMLAAPLACTKGRPEVTSCADSLDGVWKTADGRGYDITENRTGIEIFAMFDTTAPPSGDKRTSPVIYAPVAFDLRRVNRPSDSGLLGRRTQRLTREGRICTVRTTAAIESCANNQLTLRYERPGALDWTSCRHAPTGDWAELELKRD